MEYPLVLLEPLAFLLSRLLEQLCARLGARALATQELRLDLTLEQMPEECMALTANHTRTSTHPGQAQVRQHFRRTLRLPVPLLDPKVFLKLLHLDLNANPPGAPIVKIHLSAEPVRPRATQSGLFLPPSPEPEKLELTLARIAGIVGQDKVGSLQLLDTHRPEGFLMRHFAPNRGPKRSKDKKDKDNNKNKEKDKVEKKDQRSVKPFSRRQESDENKQVRVADKPSPDPNLPARENAVTALRIFRPPVRATITLREGRPTHIACLKRKEICGEILWAAGPWRTSGDWWEQEGWARDEWDIALQEAAGIALYRLVRDLLSGQWQVEGSYD